MTQFNLISLITIFNEGETFDMTYIQLHNGICYSHYIHTFRFLFISHISKCEKVCVLKLLQHQLIADFNFYVRRLTLIRQDTICLVTFL